MTDKISFYAEWYSGIKLYAKTDADFGRLLKIVFAKVFEDKELAETPEDKLIVSMVLGSVKADEKFKKSPGRPKKNQVQAEQTEKEKAFKKPTVEEIQSFLDEKKINNVDAQSFFCYYESNGWKVGKSKMRNWQMAVQGWAKRSFNKPSPKKTSQALKGSNYTF